MTTNAAAALAPPDAAISPPTTDLPAAWHRTLITAAKRVVNKAIARTLANPKRICTPAELPDDRA